MKKAENIRFLLGILVFIFAALLALATCSSPEDLNDKENVSNSTGEEDTLITANSIAVTGVSLKTSTSIVVGGTETLIAAITPSDATNKNVTWNSSNPTIAKVSTDGVVTGISAGTALIVVATKDGGHQAMCNVTVSNFAVNVTGISLKESTNIIVGGIEALTAVITPADATNQNVTWNSSNSAVAAVSEGGVVSAISVGTATITVTTDDGGHQASCIVTVSPIVVTGVSLKEDTYIVVRSTETLYANIEPDNATNKNVTWRSSNPAIATVSADGVVTAVSAGIATITVTTVDGGHHADCAVTVSNYAVSVTGVSLNKSSTGLIFGCTEDLTATITPHNATNQNITWSSNNTAVATVSAGGEVTAKKVGSAIITVTTVDGNKTASCNITVNPKVITFTVDAINTQIYTGSAIQPVVTVRDGSTVLTQTTDYTVAYTNNINAGTATVTVSGAGNYAGSSVIGIFTINKATGAVVSAPSGTSSVTGSSITINAVTAPSNGQTVEYAKNTANTIPSLGWQDSTTFNGLTEGTTYYIFARSKENANYTVGTSSVSLQVSNDLVIIEWAQTSNTGSSASSFKAMATDSFGNVYAAGVLYGTNKITYGPDVFVQGTYSGSNVLLVKYNSSGTAQWARTVNVTGSYANSEFRAVAVDSLGNVYAAGYQQNTFTYTYGMNVSASGSVSGNASNVVLVKYDSNGNAQWAKTAGGGGSWGSEFNTVAVDSSGNVYAAGFQDGKFIYNYGADISISGVDGSYNVVLVKYDSSGVAQWAKTIIGIYNSSSGSNHSVFKAVAVDSSGNVYAAGSQLGSTRYTYGTDVHAQGIGTSNLNIVLVKYNSSGVAQWAKTVSAGSNDSIFYAVTTDSSGNVYAAGYQDGNGIFTYGTGVSSQGTYTDNNVILVKYNSSGTTQWARTISTGNNKSRFNALAADSSGNVYAAGYQNGNGIFTYGTGVSSQGTYTDNNVVLVKYDSSGVAQWARTIKEGNNKSEFNTLSVDSSCNVYVAGFQNGNGIFGYGNGVIIQGSSTSYNSVLVKYK